MILKCDIDGTQIGSIPADMDGYRFAISLPTITAGRPVTGRHMRCAKKEHLDMTTCTPGLPVSERTLRAFGHHRPSKKVASLKKEGVNFVRDRQRIKH